MAEIVAGGPMMGVAVKSPAFPVAKNTSGVLFLTKKEAALSEEGPCIGCGRCEANCPQHLPIRKDLEDVAGLLERLI